MDGDKMEVKLTLDQAAQVLQQTFYATKRLV